jgi:plasmid stability protein
MPTLTVRNVPDETKSRLRIRAAEHGRSMEAELRVIIDDALNVPAAPEDLGEAIRRRFAKFGGVELELPERTPAREPPDFSE